MEDSWLCASLAEALNLPLVESVAWRKGPSHAFCEASKFDLSILDVSGRATREKPRFIVDVALNGRISIIIDLAWTILSTKDIQQSGHTTMSKNQLP